MEKKTKTDKTDKTDKAILELARSLHQEDGGIEFDDGALVSEGEDNGAYVQAWVWVSFEGTKFDKENGDEEEEDDTRPGQPVTVATFADVLQRMKNAIKEPTEGKE